ncbi:MAG: type II secretion system F family protein [Candidatus Eisenbacteria bacterium]|nr:type II secretion system F family protein [Candidatus Eisenbacteria bacterium]
MIAAQLEREDAWRDRVTRVTSYPLLVLGSTILTGVILFRVVLPTVSALSEELGSAPPLATRVALWIGRAGGSAVVWLVAATVLGLTVWSVSNHERLRTISSRIPGLAETVRLAEAWKYFGVLSILSRASIPLDRALEIAAVVVTPDDWREVATELARRVKAGDAPGAAARRAQWLPSRTSRVLGLAEVSGTMPQAFASLAGHAEVLLTRRLERLARWMPLVLLAFAAVLIGFLAQAMLMPAFQIDLPT